MCQNTIPQSLYSPLVLVGEIRLIKLQPGSAGSDVHCILQHAKLSNQPSNRPQYEALSYEWGPQTCLQTIRINDTIQQVRENLWSALRHLRLESEPRLLWIDALCINQEDILERNQQVNQMGVIYSQARRVVVWLGQQNSSSTITFSLL